jgi:putative transposase
MKNKAVYLAIGMRPSGHKQVLGMWIKQSEGAKFCLRVMNEIRGRGTQNIVIAVVDGLQGFPEAITAVFQDFELSAVTRIQPLRQSKTKDSYCCNFYGYNSNDPL